MKAIKDELLRWTCKTHATNNYLDRRVLREKALELSKIRGLSGFKCSERWLNSFLRDHGFSYDLADRTGPTFVNYRDWIDVMRPTITKYSHNDLFHVDELSMYTDVLPSTILSDRDVDKLSPRNRVTILMGCNSSGTDKFPLLICGSYPSETTMKEHVYCNSEDSFIEDKLFKNWLSQINERMFNSNRKILMFLRRNRAQALKNFAASNLKLIYLPENFPPLLRPLRKEIFHYIKMLFRRKYAERLKRSTKEWGLPEILKALIEAWEKIPREIIVFSFQRTQFRTDECFLQIDCDCWDASKMGISFKRFVTFDDKLSDEQPYSNSNSRYHGYNLRTYSRDVVLVDKDQSNSVTENVEVLMEKKYSTFDSNYQIPSGLRDHMNQKLNKTHRDSRRSFFRKNADARGRKRAYSETRFKSRERNVKTTFVSRDSKVTSSRSICGKTMKWEEELRRHRTDVESRESLRAIVDKALTLTSLVNAEYTKKLINSIHESLQEISEQASNARSFENDAETKRRKVRSDAHETFMGLKSPTKENQPSTSKSNLNSLSEAATSGMGKNEGVFKETADLNAEKCEKSQDTNEKMNVDGEESFASKLKKKREKGSEEDSSAGEPSEKRSKVDHDWSKQFETNFAFGSQNANCSQGVEHDDKTVDSCAFNVKSAVPPRD